MRVSIMFYRRWGQFAPAPGVLTTEPGMGVPAIQIEKGDK